MAESNTTVSDAKAAPSAPEKPPLTTIDMRKDPRIAELSKSEDVFKMNHRHRGYAVIINNTVFDRHLQLNERKGSEKDQADMQTLLQNMGFEKERIFVYNNEMKSDMERKMEEASKKDYKDCDCFIGVILTHGTREGQIYGTDHPFDLSKLIEPFKGKKCNSLVGKPKLFFIQACRGHEKDEPATAADAQVDEELVVTMPSEADLLVGYATTPGYVSWRDTGKGSWFIQSLVEVFNEQMKKESLMTMLVEVTKRVTLKSTSENDKQVPSFTSMMTKKVFFF